MRIRESKPIGCACSGSGCRSRSQNKRADQKLPVCPASAYSRYGCGCGFCLQTLCPLRPSPRSKPARSCSFSGSQKKNPTRHRRRPSRRPPAPLSSRRLAAACPARPLDNARMQSIPTSRIYGCKRARLRAPAKILQQLHARIGHPAGVRKHGLAARVSLPGFAGEGKQDCRCLPQPAPLDTATHIEFLVAISSCHSLPQFLV